MQIHIHTCTCVYVGSDRANVTKRELLNVGKGCLLYESYISGESKIFKMLTWDKELISN